VQYCFCLDIAFSLIASNFVCYCYNILFGGRPFASLCTLQEEMELNEQFLPASSRQWLKKKKSSMFSFFYCGDFEGPEELEQWERLLLFK